jgi:hypothetical protein
MATIRETLFAGEALQIGLFHAQPSTYACGDTERQSWLRSRGTAIGKK